MMRVKVSKNARATRSLLKVLRRCIWMRIMIIMAFPKIPKTAMVSLVKRSIHDDHSSYSSFTELPHPWFVTLFVRILAYLDHAALVLIFGSANNVTLLMVKAKMSEIAANFLAILTTDCIQFIDYLSNSFSSISQVQIFWLRRQVLDLYKGGLRFSPIQFHRSPQTRGLVAISRLLVTHSTCMHAHIVLVKISSVKDGPQPSPPLAISNQVGKYLFDELSCQFVTAWSLCTNWREICI